MRGNEQLNWEIAKPALAGDSHHGRLQRGMRRWGLAALCLSLASLAGACGPATATPAAPVTTSTSPAAATPTTATISRASTAAPPAPTSAAQYLAGSFTQAEQIDAKLRQAAALINTGFVGNTVRIDQETIAAIRDIRPETMAHTIPAGLDPDLRRLVLQVYADLVSRRAAMNGIIEYASDGALRLDSAEGRHLLACLANGSTAAATFKRHLAVARTAASMATPAVAAPMSRGAAEIAILATYIRLVNNGCGDCGGYVLRDLPPLTWKAGTAQLGDRLEGTVGGIQFRARFHATRGWTVNLNAC